jgi:hypothetical membrane protein
MSEATFVVPNSVAHRLLLGAGLVGAVLFPVVFLVDGALRPGYNGFTQPISDLALGPTPAVQIANFIVYGVLTAVSAIGWRASLAPGAASIAYPVLKVVTGLALIATGILHEGTSHNIVAYTSLFSTIADLFIIAWRLRREPRWRGWALYAVISAIVMMGCLAIFGIEVPHHQGGAFEKLATITAALFSALLAAQVLANHGRFERNVTDGPVRSHSASTQGK